MYKLTVGAITAILLTGCADLHPRTSLVMTSPMAVTDCGDLLGYYESILRMKSERRTQELIATTEAWTLAPDGCNQLRLAMMLNQPGYSEKDRKKALKLLTDLLDEGNNINMEARQLAVMLKDQLEQLQSQQLLIHQLRHKLKQERVASQLLLKQLTDLESQLEQLKNIEENINEKEQAIITPAATDNIPNEPAQNSTGR